MTGVCIVFDLDDTLYKEVEYVRSAYRYISRKMEDPRVYGVLMDAFDNGLNPFDTLRDTVHSDIDIIQLLEWYRFHSPDLKLSDSVENTLSSLVTSGYRLGLITDGRSQTQRNKIKALGLDRLIGPEDIVISEEFGSEKPAERNFLYFQELYPDSRMIYVGDNPRKDFIAPNRLGWQTVGLNDNGENIHKQIAVDKEFEPDFWISDIKELPELVAGGQELSNKK